jgi:hypothetical protein
MSNDTEEVIKRIASIQLDAIQRIIDNPSKYNKFALRKFFGVTDEMVTHEANKLRETYKGIIDKPAKLYLLHNDYQFLVCSHILFRMEDTWILEFPNGVRETWEILNKALYDYHPEFKLIF